jgi:hypothetical protein
MALHFVVRELPLPSFIEESLIIATYIDPAEGLPKELPKKYGIFSGKPESRPNATRLPLIAQVPHVGTRFLQDTQPVTRVTRRAERVRLRETKIITVHVEIVLEATRAHHDTSSRTDIATLASDFRNNTEYFEGVRILDEIEHARLETLADP